MRDMKNRFARPLVGAFLMLCAAGCGGGGGGGSPPRAVAFVGDYAGFLAVAPDHALIPGDSIAVANDWGGYFFTLSGNVTNVRVRLTGAGGSQGGSSGGGTPGSGTFDMTPAFLTSQSASGFWLILGEAGRASAGETTPIANFMSYNGGGAATDWSLGQGTYTYAGGGGGSSDARTVFAGDQTNPHFAIDPCAAPGSRFAVVGGGGGGTDNGGAFGGAGGGFNTNGGDGAYSPGLFGTGGTLIAGGNINGSLCYGGNGLQDGSEGWAGGGGGGYFGGGAPTAHGGGGGGSGFLLSNAYLLPVTTLSGAQGGNATTTLHGSFTIIVN